MERRDFLRSAAGLATTTNSAAPYLLQRNPWDRTTPTTREILENLDALLKKRAR